VNKPLLGIIGGMGPLATVYFHEMLTKIQKPDTEQGYLDVLLYSIPSAPDRTAFITGKSDADPFDSMLRAGRVLERQHVTAIAIPCVTAHFFYNRLVRELNTPIINIVNETAEHIAGRGIKKAGLLATDGTVNGLLFHHALAERGIETLVPFAENQKTLMDLIYEAVKRGGCANREIFTGLCGDLRNRGAETVVLGCTELSLAARDLGLDEGFTDALFILAKAALAACG
jgi:aspartate racemase